MASRRIPVLVLAAALVACGTQAGRRAGEGAATGAVAGAAGGLLTALVFGGNPVDRAARGAVYGAGAGAATGAMVGAKEDSELAKRQAAERKAELEQLRMKIGDDSFAGLKALVEGKHEVALANARVATRSKNRNYSLAGVWLQVLTHADQGHDEKARELFPELLERDPDVRTTEEAEETTRRTLESLRDIREEYGLPRVYE